MTKDEHGIDLAEETDLETSDDGLDEEDIPDDVDIETEEIQEKQRKAMESDGRERRAEASANPDDHRDKPPEQS